MTTSVNQDMLDLLQAKFSNLNFIRDYPLSELTYFKIGGPAEIMVEVNQRNDLVNLVRFCRDNQIDFLVLGGASNVIVSDEGLKKVVIVTTNSDIETVGAQRSNLDGFSIDSTLIRADSGIKTSDLVTKTVVMGLTGLEPFLGVPGKLGGAIFNNSHFQTELIGDYVTQVEVLTTQNHVIWIPKNECQFEYDFSRFQKSKEIILRVEFSLKKGDKQQSKQLIRNSMIYRSKTQPLHLPSSGCIFKNVKNTPQLRKLFKDFEDREFISAGFLIDQAGLKGLREGGIEVSTKHAAFMVNHGDGKAKDLRKLIKKVKQKVYDKFGVELKEEVFWIE
jgi:UDP-N-acetylmuramate dehydrogenase